MLDVAERQQILRLLVKETLVDAESLTIRHCIPLSESGGPAPSEPPAPQPASLPVPQEPSYLLRSRSIRALTCEAHQAV